MVFKEDRVEPHLRVDQRHVAKPAGKCIHAALPLGKVVGVGPAGCSGSLGRRRQGRKTVSERRQPAGRRHHQPHLVKASSRMWGLGAKPVCPSTGLKARLQHVLTFAWDPATSPMTNHTYLRNRLMLLRWCRGPCTNGLLTTTVANRTFLFYIWEPKL